MQRPRDEKADRSQRQQVIEGDFIRAIVRRAAPDSVPDAGETITVGDGRRRKRCTALRHRAHDAERQLWRVQTESSGMLLVSAATAWPSIIEA